MVVVVGVVFVFFPFLEGGGDDVRIGSVSGVSSCGLR